MNAMLSWSLTPQRKEPKRLDSNILGQVFYITEIVCCKFNIDLSWMPSWQKDRKECRNLCGKIPPPSALCVLGGSSIEPWSVQPGFKPTRLEAHVKNAASHFQPPLGSSQGCTISLVCSAEVAWLFSSLSTTISHLWEWRAGSQLFGSYLSLCEEF